MATHPISNVERILRREWRRSWSTWATRAESAAVLRLTAASAAAGVPAATMLDAWAEDSRGAECPAGLILQEPDPLTFVLLR